VLLRERPTSPPDAPSGDGTPPDDDNPFAPPPENAPDRPWQPRRPAGGAPEDGQSPWGSQWSDQQPGRSPGGFGERPGRGPENGGPGEVRKVSMADLAQHPAPRWRPSPANPAFAGVYRLAMLDAAR